jgi:pimeloyl-ACP methyl ester carboxylesterase
MVDLTQGTLSREEVLQTLASSDVCRMVVVLIHGTWAHQAAWTRSGDLVVALSEEFGDQAILAHYDWTGWNSHSARLEASRQLALYLREIRSLYPQIRIALVAHSHGGNIALYTLRHDALLADAVVTISTPFLRVEPRAVDVYRRALATTARGWLCALCLVAFSWSSAIAFQSYDFVGAPLFAGVLAHLQISVASAHHSVLLRWLCFAPLAVITYMGVFGMAFWVISDTLGAEMAMAIASPLYRTLGPASTPISIFKNADSIESMSPPERQPSETSALQQQACDELATPHSVRRLLALRLQGDEAHYVLTLFDLLVAIPLRVLDFVLRILTVGLLLIAVGFMLLDHITGIFGGYMPAFVANVIVSLSLLTGGIILLLLLIVLCLWAVSSGFGETLASSILVRTFVTPNPPVEGAEVHCYDLASVLLTGKLSSLFRLRHSAYRNQAVIRSVVRWVRDEIVSS